MATSRRILADRLAARLVSLGGLTVIAAILGILVVIAGEVSPLFRSPGAEPVGEVAAPAAPLGAAAAGVDEYREIAWMLTEAGTLQFVPLRGEGARAPVPVDGLGGARVTAVAAAGPERLVLGTSDGRVIRLEVTYAVEFGDGGRIVRPGQRFGAPSVVDPEGRRAVLRLAAAAPAPGPITVAQVGPAELLLHTAVERTSLLGDVRREESVAALPVDVEGEITALAIDGRGEDLFAGTSRGRIVRIDLRDRRAPRLAEAVDVGAAVSMLGFLAGDRTLVVGTGAGSVTTWQVVVPPGGGMPRLTRIHELEPHGAPVVAFSASRRDKGFVTADAAGAIRVHHGTSGATLLTLEGPNGLRSVVLAPKGDGILAFGGAGAGIAHFALDNPHPEVTLRTLFGKVWYEGYPEPAYVWQSTGGTDDVEPKLSLIPLVYGTLKGTAYALAFAVPLALLAALYSSEFMHPALKAFVKPAVEIMAALPSVVLGFLAGLWMAPLVEQVVPGLLLVPLVVPPAVVLALLGWRRVPSALRTRLRPGTELLLLVPVVLASAWAALGLGGVVEAYLLAGDFRGWLLSALGLAYDQRNALVVGLAMGFAVIPIVFTIAEDSLAGVPQHLRAGSLALGATRWQTAVRVVLPTASPGIFSAIMIGFGRAVGETMIVLMATGNTPIMDANIFSGFRALSANIAVELPEAPAGGTLFRVLFLAAFLLFCLTFALNTAAEVIRLKLRERYRDL